MINKWDIIYARVRLRHAGLDGTLRLFGTRIQRLNEQDVTLLVGSLAKNSSERMLWPTKQSAALFKEAGIEWLPSGDLVLGSVERIGNIGCAEACVDWHWTGKKRG